MSSQQPNPEQNFNSNHLQHVLVQTTPSPLPPEQLFVPPLEPVFWSDDEHHHSPFTEQAALPHIPSQPSHLQTLQITTHANPHSPPSTPTHNYVQPSSASPLPSTLINPSVAHPLFSPTSPTQGNASNFADAWILGLQNDLSGPHAPQTVRNYGNNNRPIQHPANNSDVGAYVAPHHLNQGANDGTGPSNVANPLHQLHGALDEHNQASMPLINNNGLIPDSSMTRLVQIPRQAPPLQLRRQLSQRLTMMRQQQNPYIQEQVARSTEFTPVAPADNPTPERRPIRDGAITKPPRYKKSGQSHGKIRCTECPEVFEGKVNALRHLRGCHPRKKSKYPCMHCSASYEGIGARKVHMRRAHPEVMPPVPTVEPLVREVDGQIRYFCGMPNCTRSYTASTNLNRHIEMHHTKIRYPCKCGYEATTRANLKVHKTTCRSHRTE